MKKLCLIVLAFFLLFSACDTQKYLSYNYDAEKFSEIASFSGRVTDVFTGESVSDATIRIEKQSTITDSRGFYRLDYVLSEDAQLSKQIDIVVSAQNYLPHIQPQTIFPGDFPLDIELEYASPIIEETGCFLMTFCQAIVFDYQGAEDIDSVTAHFKYWNENNILTREFDIELELIEIVSENVAHFQAVVEPFTQFGERLGRAYSIKAFDKSGYFDSEHHYNNPKNPDQELFDPDP